MGSLHELWRKHRDRVDFAVVYIREAHPEEGWVVSMNRDEDIRVHDPASDAERMEVATTCAIRLSIEMPVVVDDVSDAVASAYGAMPERLYLIGREGKVAYKGGIGPMFFRPAEWEEAIAAYLEEGA